MAEFVRPAATVLSWADNNGGSVRPNLQIVAYPLDGDTVPNTSGDGTLSWAEQEAIFQGIYHSDPAEFPGNIATYPGSVDDFDRDKTITIDATVGYFGHQPANDPSLNRPDLVVPEIVPVTLFPLGNLRIKAVGGWEKDIWPNLGLDLHEPLSQHVCIDPLGNSVRDAKPHLASDIVDLKSLVVGSTDTDRNSPGLAFAVGGGPWEEFENEKLPQNGLDARVPIVLVHPESGGQPDRAAQYAAFLRGVVRRTNLLHLRDHLPRGPQRG